MYTRILFMIHIYSVRCKYVNKPFNIDNTSTCILISAGDRGTPATFIILFSQSNEALQPEFKYSKMAQMTGKTTVKYVNNHTLGRGRVRLLQKCLDHRGKDTLIHVFWSSQESNQKLGLIGRFKLLKIIIHFFWGGGIYCA